MVASNSYAYKKQSACVTTQKRSSNFEQMVPQRTTVLSSPLSFVYLHVMSRKLESMVDDGCVLYPAKYCRESETECLSNLVAYRLLRGRKLVCVCSITKHGGSTENYSGCGAAARITVPEQKISTDKTDETDMTNVRRAVLESDLVALTPRVDVSYLHPVRSPIFIFRRSMKPTRMFNDLRQVRRYPFEGFICMSSERVHYRQHKSRRQSFQINPTV